MGCVAGSDNFHDDLCLVLKIIFLSAVGGNAKKSKMAIFKPKPSKF
jgi:hypothetical protein